LTRRLRRQADNTGAPWAALPVVLVVLAFAGCGGGEKASSSPCPTRGEQVSFPLLESKPHTVHVLTNFGSFDVRLDVEDSPCTTSSFAALVRKRFFDGTIFHRIVPGFVIQGGDPTGTGRGGPGYTVVDVPPRGSLYTKGVVAMAKSAAEPPGTAGSQFFVVTADNAGLPPEYAILGVVTKGLPVVERIGRLGNAREQPTKRVVVLKMDVTP
jgi:cyclophilin family peptidyl-prolyl cis-trans isomerase